MWTEKAGFGNLSFPHSSWPGPKGFLFMAGSKRSCHLERCGLFGLDGGCVFPQWKPNPVVKCELAMVSKNEPKYGFVDFAERSHGHARLYDRAGRRSAHRQGDLATIGNRKLTLKFRPTEVVDMMQQPRTRLMRANELSKMWT
eukprot:g16567.t1